MKPAFWLRISLITACILIRAVPLQADDESEVVTDVAVQTGKITRATLHRYVMAYGMVEPQPAMNGQPAASSKISAPVSGILTQTLCQEGKAVGKGAILFELDTRAADALVAKAEVGVEFARKNFARKQQLHATDNISRKLYDEAEHLLQAARKDLATAQTQRDLLRIRAPLAGTITTVYFRDGETVGLYTAIADLIDLDRLDVALKIPSREALSVRLGQAVVFTLDTKTAGSQNDQSTRLGSVIFISQQIDSLTDTVLVRASVKRDSSMRPGQFVRARIAVEERANRLVVPLASIVPKQTGSVIAIVEGNSAKQIAVTPGLREGDHVEISGDGLKEGMTVVTQGAYGLPPETRIRIIN
jgi:membrane fusion protein (multidrug efflux system)